jgi:serine/threonine-protein kinase
MLNPGNLTGITIDQFRLDEFIGQGSMGIVYKAFDNVLKRTVAIKLIPKGGDTETPTMAEARKRLIQEAQAAGRLSHPNIVTIHSYGETDDFQYICMEYITGKTLADILEEENILPVEEAIEIIEQVLLALDKAHQEQIVHRDIKPSNIMVLPDKRAKVMDFGIAKIPSLSMTTTGTVLGTPYYMSPEQISGQKVDILSDIFSVGAVFYQMITGVRPFEGETTVTLAYKIVQVDPIPPRILRVHIPQEIENICKKALAKDPAQRFQSPLEMLEALRAYKNRDKTGKKPLVDTTIKSRVAPLDGEQTVAAPIGEERTVIAPVTIPVTAESVQPKAVEPPPVSPPPPPPQDRAQERPQAPKPKAQVPPAQPAKTTESRLKALTIAVSLILVMIIGIVLVIRFAKSKTQPSLVPPSETATAQPGSSSVRTTSRQTPEGLDRLVAEAKPLIQGNPARAKKLLLEVLAQDPDHFEANFQMGRLMTFEGDFLQAVLYYRKAEKVNPRFPEIHFNLGYIFMTQGEYDKALQAYESCRSLHPPYLDEVLTNMGFCYQKKNDLIKAESYFREAVKLNPNNMIAQKYLTAVTQKP